ncbi:ABC transporter ATP-binding protein [Geothrix edaphica]|uniref:ABC transporter ATP-binding protein n=1 Tax=Geothrix edaphica TaxID=2927976 RepID=A0ABQ5PUQ4_9BACT|nr:ABC transporter ATP-binding protein [Geothrix edaphica]GLH66093.1 ABC transporter ATP-binding protein [Geothrix edaphica]
MADLSESKLFWWWPLMDRHRRTLYWGLAATVWCSVAASVVPYWSGRAVNALERHDWQGSRVFLAWMLAFTAAAGIGRYLMRNTLIGLSRDVEREQRESLYSFLLARPFAFYERQRVGDLMSRLGDDVGTVRMATGPGLMSFLQVISILPVTLGLMFSTSWRLTLAVMLPFSFLALGFYIIGKWSHMVQQKLQLAFSALSTYSHETISGERVVQAFGLEEARVAQFDALSRRHASLSMKQSVIFSAYAPLSALISGVSALVLVTYGGSLVVRGVLNLGDLTAFTGFLVALAWPMMSLGWSANLFQRAKAGQERLDQLLHSPEQPLPPAEAIALPEVPAALALEGVTHRFETGRGLGPLEITLAPGDSLAVVGGIGAGKTLLLQVLAGLRAPQAGRMLVDGEPLSDTTLRRHWAGLGWVPQEAFLFSETLRMNLAMGRPEATEEEIWEIARVVAMDELIHRLPDGLDTVVGERGVALSGGERQRTALARALLRRPRLLLLDDALSAVDAETESRILENLRAFLGKSTLVLATHRVFVAETCARVLVLEEGRVVQFDTPEALAAQPGLFARLKRLQSLERELVKGVV